MEPTIDQFNVLDTQEKANHVWEIGEFLISREYYGNMVNLYVMPGYYAEVIYNSQLNQIEDIKAFESIDQEIDKYWSYIKMES